jgi:putative DNA primase/helicase
MGTWKAFQKTRATAGVIKQWYASGRHGVGLVLGEISGGLELFEFEEYPTYGLFKERAINVGLQTLIERIEEGYLERSPSGGMHWLYRCLEEIRGSTKLAKRPTDEPSKFKTLIETKGEGGYVIIAPSCGGVHPTGGAYELLRGGLDTIVDISPEERDDLWSLARTFDACEPTPLSEATPPSSARASAPALSNRPWDVFARKTTWGEILLPHGWVRVSEADGVTYWRRPGKVQGVSATTNYGGSDLLYVFSTSTEFEADRAYTKFAAYALLNYDNDFKAAAAHLGKDGFGDSRWFKHTELGNAERFAAQFSGELKYVHQWKSWLFWDGRRWAKDQTKEVIRKAKLTVRSIYQEAGDQSDDHFRASLARHAHDSESRRAIAAMIGLAESDRGFATSADSLDTDVWLLNCLDGVIDLKTGLLLPHDPQRLITKLAPAFYGAEIDPEAAAIWQDFLDVVTDGDPELQGFLQRCAGYSLTGDAREEKLFFIHGPGGTGKSTFLQALNGVLGDYAATANFETFVAKRSGGNSNDIARLEGKRFVVSIEVPNGERLAEALVKSITGGDIIAVRFLYGEYFEYLPQFKLWLAANDAPVVRSTDDAIWRRVLCIPLVHVIPPEERDPAIKQMLTERAELRTVILCWAVAGALAWQEHGLQVPRAVEDATNAYRADMNPLTKFIEDRCELRPGVRVSAGSLWSAFQEWKDEDPSSPAVSKNNFLRYLQQFGVQSVKGTNGTRYYLHIGVRDADDWGDAVA